MTLTLRPGGDGGRDGGQAGFGGGDLDHQVGAVHPRPQLFCLRQGGGGVVCQVGADLQADVAVAALRLLVERQEQVGGSLDVLDRQGEEDLFGGQTGLASGARLAS